MQMMSKLAQIARKPYLNRVTMQNIRRTIDEFGLDVQIVVEDGHEKLLFEANPNKRWLILKLLDDDFLGSRANALTMSSCTSFATSVSSATTINSSGY
jgi:hypothetical protein